MPHASPWRTSRISSEPDVGDHAEQRLVLLGAGPVDDLHEQQLAHLDGRARRERLARRRLEHGALPAAVPGPGQRQRLVGLAHGREQVVLPALGAAPAGDQATYGK